MLHSVEAVLLFFRTVGARNKGSPGPLDVCLGWLQGHAAENAWTTLTEMDGDKGFR
jgi:hypothetical protein